MPDVPELLRTYAAYFYFVVAVAWLGVAALENSALTSWPVVACLVAGLLLRFSPNGRITFAWAVSTATMGLLVAVYQVYAWAPLLGGDFSAVAGPAVTGFSLFALVHVFLFYAGASRPRPA